MIIWRNRYHRALNGSDIFRLKRLLKFQQGWKYLDAFLEQLWSISYRVKLGRPIMTSWVRRHFNQFLWLWLRSQSKSSFSHPPLEGLDIPCWWAVNPELDVPKDLIDLVGRCIGILDLPYLPKVQHISCHCRAYPNVIRWLISRKKKRDLWR